MDIEDSLKKHQSLFSYALTDARIAKHRYLEVWAASNSSPTEIARARALWRQLEYRKTTIIAQMVELEELEPQAVC